MFCKQNHMEAFCCPSNPSALHDTPSYRALFPIAESLTFRYDNHTLIVPAVQSISILSVSLYGTTYYRYNILHRRE